MIIKKTTKKLGKEKTRSISSRLKTTPNKLEKTIIIIIIKKETRKKENEQTIKQT